MRLEALDAVEPWLTSGVEDWEVLLRLYFRGGVAGFITNDARILDSAREMVVLSHTTLLLVVCDGVGHDPLKATGLVMINASDIANQAKSGPMTFRLRPKAVGREGPGERLNRIAERAGTPASQLIRDELAELRKILGEADYGRLRARAF
jgi:hypothetical protein